MSAPTTLGLSTSPFSSSFATPAAFLAWNWFYAYCVLSSRTFKQRYGIDHNGNPRQDIDKYGIAAVKEGKMTQEQLDQIRRVEAAGANSVDGYSVFAVSGELSTSIPISVACWWVLQPYLMMARRGYDFYEEYLELTTGYCSAFRLDCKCAGPAA